MMAKSQSELAQIEFEGWLTATSENFRFGVLSGLMTKLNPWMTDQLCALTEKTDINFEDLQNNLFTFYLAVPSRSQDSKLIRLAAGELPAGLSARQQIIDEVSHWNAAR